MKIKSRAKATNRNNTLKSVFVHKYYNFIESDKAVCLIDNCGKILKTRRNSNLKRHICSIHKQVAAYNKWIVETSPEIDVLIGDLYPVAFQSPVAASVPPPVTIPVKTPVKTPAKTPAKTPTKTPAKTPVETSANTPIATPIPVPVAVAPSAAVPVSVANQTDRELLIIKNVIKLVTIENCPVSILNSNSFQYLMAPSWDSFNLEFNSQNIRWYIATTVNNMNKIIRTEIRNKLLCLKLDLAQYLNYSVLAVNIQFLNGGNIVLRTLGLIEILISHTGVHLKQQILDILLQYDIDILQIYSCIIDDCSNMFNAVSIIQDEQQNLLENQFYKTGEANVTDITNDMLVFSNGFDWTIQSRKCAAYELQLSVNEAIKMDYIQDQLLEIQDLVMELQQNIAQNEFLENQQRIPTMDLNGTIRWVTSYEMIAFIVEQQEFIREILSKHNTEYIQILNKLMPFAKSFYEIITPFALATKTIQEKNLTIGDVFKIWLELELEIADNQDTLLSKMKHQLLSSMETRKNKLLQSDTFLAAIYLDPRFNYFNSKFLTEDNKIRAVKHLQNIHEHLNENKFLSIKVEPSTSKALSRLEQKMRNEELTTESKYSKTLEYHLKNMCQRTRFKCSTDILQYWEQQSHVEDLYALSQVVYATAASQFSLPKSLIGLSKLAAKQISCLHDNYDDIFIRLNSDVFDSVDLSIYKEKMMT